MHKELKTVGIKVQLLSLEIVVLLFTCHSEVAVLNLNAIFTPESSYIWTCVWITGPGALQLQDNGPDHLNLLSVGFTCAWQRVFVIRPHNQTGGSSHID